MIHKLQFQTHLVAVVQDSDSGGTLLRVNPDIPAEFGRCRCQGRSGELIKPVLLGQFTHALAHCDDVRLLIDPDFPGFFLILSGIY